MISWKDVLHYGSALILLSAAALETIGVHLPGIHVDAGLAATSGVGILVAGLKGGVLSGK